MPGKKGEVKPRRTATRRGGASVNQDLVKALAHPLRVEILAILNDRMASPKELAKELDEGLSQVSYHVKVLRDFNCIRMVKTEPRRGAVEHYYQAIVKAYVTTDAARKLPKSARRSIWGPIMRDIDYDVETSVEAGTFDARPNHYVGRVNEILDDRDWKKQMPSPSSSARGSKRSAGGQRFVDPKVKATDSRFRPRPRRWSSDRSSARTSCRRQKRKGRASPKSEAVVQVRVRPKAQAGVPHTCAPFWRRRRRKDDAPPPLPSNFDFSAVRERSDSIEEIAGLSDAGPFAPD